MRANNVFKCKIEKYQDDGWFGYINTALTAGSAYLPSTVTETLLQVIMRIKSYEDGEGNDNDG